MTTTTPGLSTPAEVLSLIQGSAMLAVDLETCGPPGKGMQGALDPRTGRIRLLAVANWQTALVMDCFQHDLRQILPALAGKTMVAHYAQFDIGFLAAAGLECQPVVIDTWRLARLLSVGAARPLPYGYHSLAACVERYLGRQLDKELQTSDWSGELTAEQVEYARRDAAVLIPLLEVMTGEGWRRGLLSAEVPIGQ